MYRPQALSTVFACMPPTLTLAWFPDPILSPAICTLLTGLLEEIAQEQGEIDMAC